MEEFTKYRLTLSYDGTDFHGWQKQASDRTVQGVLEQAVAELFPGRPSVHGASRTDAGVHALNQAAHFRTGKKRPVERVTAALNDYLPEDVTVLDTSVADPDFQAHVDARAKTYVYLLLNRREPPSLARHLLHWHPGPLETEPMRNALQKFEGTHNFLGFATNAEQEETPCCKMLAVELMELDSCYCFVVTGDRFLYNMVRSMVGTLVEVGKGNADPDLIPSVFRSRERSEAGPVIAARGLYLYRVYYELPGPQQGSVREDLDELLGKVV